MIQKQEQRIFEIQGAKPSSSKQPGTNNDSVKVLEEEIALVYGPLQQAMASAFKLKESKLWLTIRFSKDKGHIVAVYVGRKSSRVGSSQSILSSHG